jgi:hypothetical protein
MYSQGTLLVPCHTCRRLPCVGRGVPVSICSLSTVYRKESSTAVGLNDSVS